ncbi:class I SAM-dependent methyltransferase [Candidatus Pelagibacter sp.]|jgi:ubiquinone/menaquinone biosynthesis C-methylase UbiE|nr:class I SAM-dependent methyltransferase [Candidatus Pelagibacter sp.]
MTNLNRIKNYYNFYLKKHKRGSRAVNWGSKKSHQMRFSKILEAGNFNNKKIHDVGCGLAHFYIFLKDKKIKFDYIGSDISEDMIENAKVQLNNKKVNLQNLNLLEIDNRKLLKQLTADFVVANGLFTVKTSLSNEYWWKYIRKMLRKMFYITNECLVFNLMKSNVDYKDKHLYYQSVDQLLKFIEKNLSNQIVIKQDYPLYEFMVYVYKK